MKTGTFVLIAGLIALSSPALAAESGAPPGPPKDCSLQRYDSIDLVEGRYVPVELEGRAGFMSLDLARVSFIDRAWLGMFAVPLSDAKVAVHDPGIDETYVANFSSLKIGKMRFDSPGKFLGMPVSQKEGRRKQDGRTVFGVLGADILGAVDFELDLSRGKLNLFSQDHCPGQVVYWADDWGTAPLMVGKLGTIYFAAELEGQKVEAAFSLAEPFTRLNTDVTKRLYGFDEESPGVETGPLPGNPRALGHYRAMELTAHGMSVKNVSILLAHPPSGGLYCALVTEGREGGGAGTVAHGHTARCRRRRRSRVGPTNPAAETLNVYGSRTLMGPLVFGANRLGRIL